MISYQQAYKDGYEFARLELLENISKLEQKDLDDWTVNHLCEMIEGNQL
jgi:hypothetical protein